MTEEKKTVTLEELPIHELKRACKEKEIRTKRTDKKKDLIKMLRTGETIHKPRETKRSPQLEDSKPVKAIPMIPKEIRKDLEALAAKGLTWTIDEEVGCINFMKNLPTCANLDQSAKNILRTAQDSFGGRMPIERGRNGERIEWA